MCRHHHPGPAAGCLDLCAEGHLRKDRGRQSRTEDLNEDPGLNPTSPMTAPPSPPESNAGPLPAVAGVGLRHPHHRALLDGGRCTGWLEAHAENYMSGGWSAHVLDRLRQTYPLSLHGVGLSLGGAGRLDEDHLDRLKQLVQRIEPALVSEHVAWTGQAGLYLNDLLPLP